jgi:hypothetical protein
MLQKIAHWVPRHGFLLIGILTLFLLLLVSGLERTGELRTAHMLAMPLRILVAPMYLMWMLWTVAQVAIAGRVGLPQPLASTLLDFGLLAGLAPYALADCILGLWSRRKATRSSALR